MKKIGIIGGSGVYQLDYFGEGKKGSLETPFGAVQYLNYCEGQVDIYFIPRHGEAHDLPPHLINYRANIHAFEILEVAVILASNAVGGITEKMAPGTIVIPHDVIDYTWGREHTYSDGVNAALKHIDLTSAFDENWRGKLISAIANLDIDHESQGVYGCTQGPRLETPAEIKKLKFDGNDVVGMTLMPELALAKEKAIPYVSLCLVVNWAAGITNEIITMDAIRDQLSQSAERFNKSLREFLKMV